MVQQDLLKKTSLDIKTYFDKYQTHKHNGVYKKAFLEGDSLVKWYAYF